MDAEQTSNEQQTGASSDRPEQAEQQAAAPGETGSGNDQTGNVGEQASSDQAQDGINVNGIHVPVDVFQQILLTASALAEPVPDDGVDAEKHEETQLGMSDVLNTLSERLAMLNESDWQPENATRGKYRLIHEMLIRETRKEHEMWHAVLRGFDVTQRQLDLIRSIAEQRGAFIREALPMLTENATRFDRLIICVGAAKAAGSATAATTANGGSEKAAQRPESE